MLTGQFAGYTGDTLIHLADGSRKYMRDLAVDDELIVVGQDSDSHKTIKVISKIKYQFDGFIKLVAPGIGATQFTLPINTDNKPPTLYYTGPMYHFVTNPSALSIMAGSRPDNKGIYSMFGDDPDGRIMLMASDESPDGELPGVWCDPPGVVTKRITHAERMAALASVTVTVTNST